MRRPWAGPDSPRMFQNDFLDALSRVHWAFVPLLYVPAVIWLGWTSFQKSDLSAAGFAGLYLAGIVIWTLTEYWLHRTFFHWIPKTSWGPKMHFLVHGVHHEWPHDRFRLVMPPAVSIPLFFLFLGLWSWIFEDKGWAVHAGFVTGYIVYDLTHYYVHHGRPKVRLLRKLQGHHMSHHFNTRYLTTAFGCSSPLWACVFGTRN